MLKMWKGNILLLHQAPNNTEGVVERTLGLIENQVIGATDQDGDGLACVLDTGDFHDSSAVGLNLFNKISTAEFVFCERLNVGDRFAASRLLIYHVNLIMKPCDDGGSGERTLQMNSTSSLSMSLIARMPNLERKWSDRSLTASRRIDF